MLWLHSLLQSHWYLNEARLEYRFPAFLPTVFGLHLASGRSYANVLSVWSAVLLLPDVHNPTLVLMSGYVLKPIFHPVQDVAKIDQTKKNSDDTRGYLLP